LGALLVKGLQAVNREEANAAGCKLVLKNATNAGKAWKDAVKKLRDFRQQRNPGNGNRPGRSHWPEPDAIRRLTGQNSPNHVPKRTEGHEISNVFPRAAFGLPIIFHFKDTNAGDPADHTLQAQGHDRLASPLILRPYTDGRNWFAAALLLPHHHVESMELELKRGEVTISRWSPEKAAQVPPIASTHATDALSAFLEFFQQ
jgi:CRISPR-associated protein Cmr1